MFSTLHKNFEKSDVDLVEMQSQSGFSRYLLIRSLEKEHLSELLLEQLGDKFQKGKDLYEQLFNSEISIDRLITYIREKYPAVRKERLAQESHLPKIIANFGQVKCGIRNDDLNDLTKELVRDKTISSKPELEAKIKQLLDGRVFGYILWQYYNQVTNDLIEHCINDHPKIIPTLRKIRYVDFMVLIDGKIVPFDLKITHISDDYFDLFSRGIKSSNLLETGDDFEITDAPSELEAIKKFYKSMKGPHSLPNYGGMKKPELLTTIDAINSPESKTFVQLKLTERKRMVQTIKTNLHSLEWWNYKYQGERLFKNNNRFFVFLAYENSFEDARPLKGKIEFISAAVSEKLNELALGIYNKIHYNYTKDKGLAGKYVANSKSVLVCE